LLFLSLIWWEIHFHNLNKIVTRCVHTNVLHQHIDIQIYKPFYKYQENRTALSPQTNGSDYCIWLWKIRSCLDRHKMWLAKQVNGIPTLPLLEYVYVVIHVCNSVGCFWVEANIWRFLLADCVYIVVKNLIINSKRGRVGIPLTCLASHILCLSRQDLSKDCTIWLWKTIRTKTMVNDCSEFGNFVSTLIYF
jgi:hypothetical protein